MTQPNRETFECKGDTFRIEFVPPAQNDDGTPLLGLVKNENKWQLFRVSYQQVNGLGGQVKTPQSQKRPRWKSLGFFDSAEEAKAEAERAGV